MRFLVLLKFGLPLLMTLPVSASKRLHLTGSSTVAPLMLEMGKAFEAKNPGLRVDVQTGGSTRGILDARRHLADFGMISRSLRADEKDLAQIAVARDGIGLIVHASNPVKKLSHQQVVNIFTGKIRNWLELGGKDATIVVVNKAEGRSTLELFLEHFNLKNSQIRADVIIGDNEQGVKTVGGNPNSIGYVSVGTAESNLEYGTPLSLITLDNVMASSENVRNGTYPLSRVLHLVVNGSVNPVGQKFIEFVHASENQSIIEGLSFVPLKN